MNNTIKFLAVCAGAPLLALGVGAPAAGADPTTSSGHANVSICHNGVTQVKKGSASTFCTAGNSAVATGAGSTAVASLGGGTGNKAVATGGSHALAGVGLGSSNNTAIATHGSNAGAGNSGSNNTAIATNGGTAGADFGTTAHAHNGQIVTTP
jgi:hypothetical protein